VTKIAVAQVYLLLSTIKEDKDDPGKSNIHLEHLQKVSYALRGYKNPAHHRRVALLLVLTQHVAAYR